MSKWVWWKWFIVMVCLLLGSFAQLTHSYQVAQPVALDCNRQAKRASRVTALPHTHYLFSERFGWFDASHFNTGQPGKVLQDVETAVANGGGVITIQQGVRENITGYKAAYRLSGRLRKADVIPAALGIYLDWSMRFEAWEAGLPRGLVAPFTPFAVEDLPSQYLGFVSYAKKMSLEALFACYIGSVTALEEGPPDLVLSDEVAGTEGQVGIMRLQNKTFTPMVPTEAGWQRVNWPKPLHMWAMSSSPISWQFLAETTWYFAADNHNLHLQTELPQLPRDVFMQ
ncbi:MAG: hypothetical protein KDE56_11595 [Anaerolineales bacterium]|nr:hypothetical protein [Anaerolineales bacterium]